MRKKYLFYPGCMTATQQYAYELAVKRVFPVFGIELVDIDEFSCCGEPLRNVNVKKWLVFASRILAEASTRDLDIVTTCNGCYLSLNEARSVLQENSQIMYKINQALRKIGLELSSLPRVKHVIQLLYDDIGIERIKGKVKREIKIKAATHYGCHILRPREFAVDNPYNPTKLEELCNAIGIKTEDYPERLDCCMLMLDHVDLKKANLIRAKKLKSIIERKFDCLITVCPLCQNEYETRQRAIARLMKNPKLRIPVVYYVQLLGIALGFSPEDVGLHLNTSPVRSLLSKITEL